MINVTDSAVRQLKSILHDSPQDSRKGLRVQIADDVIDGSISARLADLRQKLAG